MKGDLQGKVVSEAESAHPRQSKSPFLGNWEIGMGRCTGEVI